jgi:DNA gyrase subunit A
MAAGLGLKGQLDYIFQGNKILSEQEEMSDTPDTPLVDEESPRTPHGPTVSIEEEMKTSYLDYAMSVIVSRAIPDIRDGLKPVHRRILYAMHETGNTHDKSYRKSARPGGRRDGQVPPARRFRDLRRAGADGAGFLDVAAAPRWAGQLRVHGRGQPRGHALHRGADGPSGGLRAGRHRQGNGRLPDNYDGKDREPTVLPARFPNMLVNGAGGIAVGMATNIPPHNLGEVVDATLALIEDPDLSSEDLIQFVPGRTSRRAA